MNTEQLRAEFEAWMRKRKPDISLKRYADGRYRVTTMNYAWEGYQAGRTALQSQDREDAEEIAATLATALHFIPRSEEPELYDDIERLCVQFTDHARRIEGEASATK